MRTERQRPSTRKTYRDAVFLANCRDDEAASWLAARKKEYSTVFGTPETPGDSPVLEYILLRRRSSIVDLALAEYGRCRTVLERVYKRGSQSVRAVACGNPSLFVGDRVTKFVLTNEDEPLFWAIVQKGTLAELRAVCENPELTSGMYAALIGCWEDDQDSRVSDEWRIAGDRFKRLIGFLAQNPRVRIPREESAERHYWDGFSDYEYGKLFSDGWKLAEKVPVDQEWAYYLSKLYESLVVPYKLFDDVEIVLARWTPEEEGEFSPTVSLREAIAKAHLEPRIEMLEGDDPALRRAFYSKFDPEKKEFADLDWNAWLERDKYCHIDLRANTNVWKSWKGRQKLENMLWFASKENPDVTAIGFLREQEEEYRKTNPDWFREEDAAEDNIDGTTRLFGQSAQEAYQAAVQAAEALHGKGTLASESAQNDALGANVLHEELGYYGPPDSPTYELDDETRNRLLAHARQDIAAIYGYTKSAFQTAKAAELSANRTRRLVWILLLLTVIALLA